MAKINKLPKHMADLIAAGEVVERPASVVKELMENAVDAGATSITVEIQHGGISYIRVTDDGCGIDREDVKTAFVSHATSKIKTAEDLNTILTLGFRGEALPSIAAVSKVNMITKTGDEEMGTTLSIEGGIITDFSDAGCAVGTTMIVRELFYNTPARMKFLKKDVSEKTSVTMMRILSAVFILASYVISKLQIGFIVTLMSLSWGVLSGAFMAPYILGVYSKKITKAGAYAGLIVGASSAIILTFVLGSANAPLASCIAMVIPFIVVPLVSAFTPKLDKSVIDKAFKDF